MLQVSLYRYSPETDEAPMMQDFRVDTGGRDLMVLDVLELVKSQLDSSVTYRRSCREGVCGSDGLNMNGKNGLACITPLSEVVKKGKLVIRPLPGLPVIRDLVVDMSLFYAQYEKVEPYLQNAKLGEFYQFMRIGYFCADNDFLSENPVFNKTVGLRDTWGKKQK